MVMIINLKKSIRNYIALQSFQLHCWWNSNKTSNLQVRNKTRQNKTETNPKSNRNTKKNSRFLFTSLRGRQWHLVDLAFCLCSVSQALLNFLNQEPLEGNRKLKHINMSKCGRVSLSVPMWMCFDFMSICLFSLLPGASEAKPESAEQILTEMLNYSFAG